MAPGGGHAAASHGPLTVPTSGAGPTSDRDVSGRSARLLLVVCGLILAGAALRVAVHDPTDQPVSGDQASFTYQALSLLGGNLSYDASDQARWLDLGWAEQPHGLFVQRHDHGWAFAKPLGYSVLLAPAIEVAGARGISLIGAVLLLGYAACWYGLGRLRWDQAGAAVVATAATVASHAWVFAFPVHADLFVAVLVGLAALGATRVAWRSAASRAAGSPTLWLAVAAVATGLLVTEKLPALVALAPLLVVAFLRAPVRARVIAAAVGVAVVAVSVVPYLYYSDGASWSAYGGDRYYALASTPWSGGSEDDLIPWHTRDSLSPSFVLDSIKDPSDDLASATLTYAVGRHTGVATFLPIAPALVVATVIGWRRRRGHRDGDTEPNGGAGRPRRAGRVRGAVPRRVHRQLLRRRPVRGQPLLPAGVAARARRGGGRRRHEPGRQVVRCRGSRLGAGGARSAAAPPGRGLLADRSDLGGPASLALRRQPGAGVAVRVRPGHVRAASARRVRRGLMQHIRLRSAARPLAALTALNVALLLTWSIVVPTFRGADEHVHHDLIRHLTETWRYPEYDGLDVSRRTLDALGTSPVFPADVPAVPADAATHRADRPGWADLGPDVRNGPPNQMPQHPPLYYESAAAIVRVLDGDGETPLDLAVWQLRLFSILALAPLPLLAADIARRFTRSRAVVLSAAAAVLAVPQLTHIGATVSNDPLMVLLGSLTLAGAARLATGDRRWVTAAFTGVVAGLALFTKGFAIPLVPAVALACLLPLVARRRDLDGGADDEERTGTLARAGLVASVALLFGGWWWIHNMIAYGTPQPGVRLRDRVPNVDLDKMRFAGDFSERLVSSFWGYFGWREVHLPIVLTAGMTALVVIAAVAACWRSWSRLVLLLPAVTAAAMVLSSGWGAFKKTGVSYATQGRYLFAGIAGLAVLVSLGIARVAGGRRSSWQPAGTLGVALGLQALGLWLCLHRYWAGSGIDPVRAMTRFAPIPGAATATVLALTGFTALIALWALAGGADGQAAAPNER